jgi:hypothetical protein
VSRQIRVRVSPTGEIRVEAYGFKGEGCEAATKAIEEALGKKVRSVRKGDFFIQGHQQQQSLGGES